MSRILNRPLTLALAAAMSMMAAATARAGTPTYTTNYVWDADRQLTMTIGADPGTGQRPATQRIYDSADVLVTINKGYGSANDGSDFVAVEQTTQIYDAALRTIKVSVLNGVGGAPLSVSQIDYDADGRATCKATRNNAAAFASLPASACTPTAVGPNGPDLITKSVYDAAGQILQERRGVGSALEQAYTTFTYSLSGQKLTVKDANGNLTNYVFDAFDRLYQTQFPSTTRGAGAANANDYEQYLYDPNGNVKSKRLRDATTITYDFDALNRPYRKTAPGQAVVVTTYDLADHVMSVLFSNTSTGVVYGYDTAGRQTSETTFGRAVGVGYDAASNVTSLTWPDNGFKINIGVDSLDRASNVSEAASGLVLANYGYDTLGRRQSLSRSNGVSTNYDYDAKDRLRSLAHVVPAQTSRAVGWTIGYSAADQVTSEALSNLAYLWPTTVTTAQSQARTYDGLNRDASLAAPADGYDARGNLTSDGTRRFGYDSENRLICQGATPCLGNASASAKLSYDPLGRLSQTVIYGATVNFLYWGDRLVGEYDGGGNLLHRYVHGPGTDEPLVDYASNGAKSYFLQDRHGTVVGLSDVNGRIDSNVYTYGPYGEPNAWAGSRFRYTGQIVLWELSLYHYKARVYDPVFGRFLQTDPIGYASDIDPYVYGKADPVNQSDPTGLDSDDRTKPKLDDDTPCNNSCQDAATHGQIIGGGVLKDKSGKIISVDFANAKSVRDASVLALHELDPKHSQDSNVQPYTDNFARINDLSKIDTRGWKTTISIHGTSIESPEIPGHPEWVVKIYNDPKLGNVIAVTNPTASLEHIVKAVIFITGYPINAVDARSFLSGGYSASQSIMNGGAVR